jgi:hypothetical protein
MSAVLQAAVLFVFIVTVVDIELAVRREWPTKARVHRG